MADREGRLYDGDQLLYVIARDYQRRGVLTGGVVGTLMSNLGFEQALARMGIRCVRANVGDRYVLEQHACDAAGSSAARIRATCICLDKHTTGDAIVAALAVLRALIEQRTTLADATLPVTLFPQRLINVPVHARLSTGRQRRDRPRSVRPSPHWVPPDACCCARRVPSPCCV